MNTLAAEHKMAAYETCNFEAWKTPLMSSGALSCRGGGPPQRIVAVKAAVTKVSAYSDDYAGDGSWWWLHITATSSDGVEVRRTCDYASDCAMETWQALIDGQLSRRQAIAAPFAVDGNNYIIRGRDPLCDAEFVIARELLAPALAKAIGLLYGGAGG